MPSIESRLWMIAPGWKPEMERLTDPAVTLIDFSADPQSNAATIDRFALATFFKQHGLFRKGQTGTVFEANGLEIILQESEAGQGVSAIRLTFTLDDSLKAQWQEVVSRLAESFGFRFIDPASLRLTGNLDLRDLLGGQ